MHDLSFEQKTIAPAELPPLISAIENLMHEAERLTEEAAGEHLRAFAAQMREKFGVDEIVLDEPYLPETLAHSSLRFLITLEKLMQKLERGAGDENPRTSIFDFDAPLTPQLNQRLELETARHQLAAKQVLDKERQQAFGVRKYVWRAGSDSCEICAPLDGQVFSWEDGTAPGETHPNCQCWAEPLLDDSGPPLDPIEPVYPLETLLAILIGAGTAWKIGQEIITRTEEPTPTQPKPQEKPPTGKEPPPGGRKLEWELGKNKSDLKWENQMKQRDWTKDKIDDTIKNGEEYPAPNKLREKIDPNATATRYEKDGKFVVRDDQTGEIIQISGPGEFKPMDF